MRSTIRVGLAVMATLAFTSAKALEPDVAEARQAQTLKAHPVKVVHASNEQQGTCHCNDAAKKQAAEEAGGGSGEPGSGRGYVVMPAPDPNDPAVQQVWTSP